MLSDLVHGWQEMQHALPGYQQAEDYYTGDVDEVFSDERLKAAIAATGQEYKFGLAAVPVDRLADRIELLAVRAQGAAANRLIARIAKANSLQVRWPSLIKMVLEYGDAYMQVWDAQAADQASETLQALPDRDLADAGVEVSLLNPKHCRAIYDTESEHRKAYAIRRWQVRTPLGSAWRVDLYYPDVVERYVSRVGQDPGEEASWDRYLDPDQDPGAWEIPTPTGDEIPVYHFRTDMPYGRPIHRAVYGCQNAITKMLVTQLTTTDSHGWPQRWSLTKAGAELDTAEDDPDWDDDDDAVDSGSIQGGVSSGMRSGPGTIQRFTGTDSVGQFSAADPRVFLDPASLYIRLMAQLSSTPLHEFDPQGGAPSGESLKVALEPQVKRARRMKTILTGTIQELWDYALRVGGSPEAEAVAVTWAPAQPATGASDWETVRAKQDAGVPVPATLTEAGYPQEEVDRWGLPDHPPDWAAAAAAEMAGVGGLTFRGQ